MALVLYLYELPIDCPHQDLLDWFWYGQPESDSYMIGAIFTLLYLVLSFLSPSQVLASLAQYRPILILAIITVVVTALTSLGDQFTFRPPQLYLVPFLMLAMGVSRIWIGWVGGAYDMLFEFGYSGLVLYFVGINFAEFGRLRSLFIVFAAISLVMVAVGVAAYHLGYRWQELILQQYSFDSANVLEMQPRLRWYGFLADPNDLAQSLLIALPFVCLAWIPRSPVHNLLFVIGPVIFLLYGVYMTHSRGALMGLVAMVSFAFKDRLGKSASLILGFAAFGFMMLLNFAGSRGMGISSGSGRSRLDLWSDGLGMIKTSPLFGIGYGKYTDYADQTAHNSFLLPLSELGFFGAFFWFALIVVTVMHLNTLSNLKPTDAFTERLRTYSRTVRLAMVTFLVSSYFLSRSYTITLFMLLGMGTALAEIAIRRDINPLPKGIPKAMAYSVVFVAATGLMVYLMVRSRSLTGGE